MSINRVVTALIYAVTTGITLWQTTNPTTVEAWIGVIIGAVVAGWSKYSVPNTKIAANFKDQPHKL